MHLHYLTLMRQAAYLTEHLSGGLIIGSYTQTKNEQIVEVEGAGGRNYQLQLMANPRYPAALLRYPTRRARNSTDVLAGLKGLRIARIGVFEKERVLYLEFENAPLRLMAQFFKNNANIFLVDEKGIIIDAFKKARKYRGHPFVLKESGRLDPLQMSPEVLARTLKDTAELSLAQVLAKKFLYFTPTIIRELQTRAGIDFRQPAGQTPEPDVRAIYEHIRRFFEQCRTGDPRVYQDDEFPSVFALAPFQSCAHLTEKRFSDTNEALIYFIFRRMKLEKLTYLKQRISKLLDGKIERLRAIIQNLEQLPETGDRRAYFQKMGELLISQQHRIPEGANEALVPDYYDPEMREIRIKLDPHLTVSENAQNYFRKAKEVTRRRKELQERREYLRRQLTELENLRSSFQGELNYKQLKRIEKKLTELHIRQADSEKLAEVYHPYKTYRIDGWEIWVGKDARRNDELTFRHAHKEDWWLHAQGGKGAHVIIRGHGHRQNPPEKVMRYAARLAATFSTDKHSSYVPVMVTRVKYVRKPRGAAPGAVVAERTKTIFAEPVRQ